MWISPGALTLYDTPLLISAVQTHAPPMQSILSRLQHYDHVKIVVFSDDTILKEPVDLWPVCDCLLAFFSKGFPLQKATEYVRLRQPFVFNDLSIQYTLQDRYMYNVCVYVHISYTLFMLGNTCMCGCSTDTVRIIRDTCI